MAIAIIYQRDRNAQLVETTPPVLATTLAARGLTYDGHFLWASSGDLIQLSSKPIAVLKQQATSPVQTADDICFDGEYFWGPISGNAGIGQWDRNGTRVNFIGSITSGSPTGMAFDGERLWGIYFNGLTGTDFIFCCDRPVQSVMYQFNTGISGLRGLEFDGEFLVTNNRNSGNRQFSYFDRNGNLVRTTTGGEVAGADANGLAFDGEFFYTMLAV